MFHDDDDIPGVSRPAGLFFLGLGLIAVAIAILPGLAATVAELAGAEGCGADWEAAGTCSPALIRLVAGFLALIAVPSGLWAAVRAPR